MPPVWRHEPSVGKLDDMASAGLNVVELTDSSGEPVPDPQEISPESEEDPLRTLRSSGSVVFVCSRSTEHDYRLRLVHGVDSCAGVARAAIAAGDRERVHHGQTRTPMRASMQEAAFRGTHTKTSWA